MAKIGVEVEGRFIGLRTLFLDASELEQRDLVNHALANREVQQIYVSDPLNLLGIGVNTVFPMLPSLSTKYLITVEVNSLGSAPIPEWMNIILNVDNLDVWKLRKADQVKFSDQLNVLATTVQSMTRTVPEDFNGDFTLYFDLPERQP
jgi:hypothetical protein